MDYMENPFQHAIYNKTWVFQGEASKLFQGSLKTVSRVFQEFFKKPHMIQIFDLRENLLPNLRLLLCLDSTYTQLEFFSLPKPN